MTWKSIRSEIIVSIIIVVVLSILVTGTGWYFSEMQIKKEQMVEKSMIALQPIISLASRNIDGGNLMNLRNANAMDLYKANSDLLYMQMY